MFDLLSDEWLAAWRTEMANADSHGGEWAVVLRFDGDEPGAGAVYLGFDQAGLRELRRASVADGDAPFVIAGKARVWKELLDGRADPVVALMLGRLSLEKGSMGRLAPHVKTAKAMLAAAARVPTRFPDGFA